MRPPLADGIAALLLVLVTAYSTAGGVDFGAGIWDLLAGRGRQAEAARELIDHAMGPVWEANNVWLVLAIVVTWTGFPSLFETVFLKLYPLYGLALLGLILRGAFFAFRHVSAAAPERRPANLVFGLSSLVTPFFFAASLGAIASGNLDQPFNPMAMAFGVVALAATGLSGASFLVGDARRSDPALVEYFRRRVLAAGLVLIVVGTLALIVMAGERRQLVTAMFTGPALVFVLATMLLTPAALFLVWRRIYRFYRLLTVGAAGSLVLAWGVAQAPYLVPGTLTIAQAAAPAASEVLLLVVAAGVLLVIGPALGLLLYLDQRNLLEPLG